MMSFLNFSLADVPAVDLRAAVAVSIAVGTLYCFLGYRTLRFVVIMTGFLLAGSFAAGSAAFLSEGRLAVMAVAGTLGGLCGAAAMLFLYRTGLFAVGLLGGALVVYAVLGEREESWVITAVIGAALVGGLGALLLERPMMTLCTAAIGAWVLVQGLAFFILGGESPTVLQEALRNPGSGRVLFTCWAALFVVGAAAQFASYRAPAPAKAAGK